VATAQLAGGGGAPEIDLVRVVLALVVCLAVGVAALWLLRRYGGARFTALVPRDGQRRLHVVETTRLHVRATLYVVEFDGRRILIAADQNGVVRLAESGPPAAPMP
jgi:flagellar biogenesis protein FliO